MPDLTAVLELETGAADATIDRIEQSLGAAVDSFSSALASALGSVDASPVAAAVEAALAGIDPLTLDADVSAVEAAIDGALTGLDPLIVDGDADPLVSEVEAAVAGVEPTVVVEGDPQPAVATVEAALAGVEPTVEVTGDASSIPGDVERAVGSVAAEVPVSADASGIPAEVQAAVAQAAAGSEVTVTADASPVTAAIEAAVADAEPAAIELDTSQAEEAAEDVGEAAQEAAGGVGQLTDATAAFTGIASGALGQASGFATAVGELNAGTTAAVAVGSAYAAVLGGTFSAALDAQGAQERYNATLGEYAAQVDDINVGTLNTDISTLAVSLGSSDDAIRRSVSSLVQLGEASERSGPEVAATAEQVLALAANAVALDPALGDVGAVADQMVNALARGNRSAANFGISLSTAEIESRALADTGKDTAAELTVFDRAAAGAAIASERYGDSLGSNVAEGAQNAQVQVRSLSVAFGEALEQIGQPVVAPAIDLLRSGVPVAVSLAQAMVDSGLPLIDVLTTLLRLVSMLPPGLTTAGVAFLTAHRGATLLGSGVNSLLGGLSRVIPQLSGVTVGAGTMSVAVAAAAAAFTAYTIIQSEAAAREAAHARSVQDLTAAYQAQEGTLRSATGAWLDQAFTVSENGRVLGELFAQAGLTGDELARMAQAGNVGLAELHTRLEAAGVDGEVADTIFAQLRSTMEETAEAAVRAAVSNGDLSQQEVNAALAASDANTSTGEYGAALELLESQGKIAAGGLGEVEEATRRVDGVIRNVPVERFAGALGDAFAGLDEFSGGDEVVDFFEGLPGPAERAAEAVSELKRQIDGLIGGVSSDEALDDFKSTLNGVADAARAAADANDGAGVSLSGFSTEAIRVREELRSAVDDAGAWAVAMAEAGVPVEDIRTGLGFLAADLEATGAAAGIPADQVKAFADQIRLLSLVPALDVPVSAPGAEQAARDMATTADAADRIPPERHTTVTADAASATEAALLAGETINAIPIEHRSTLSADAAEAEAAAALASAAVEAVPFLHVTELDGDPGPAADAARLAAQAIDSVPFFHGTDIDADPSGAQQGAAAAQAVISAVFGVTRPVDADPSGAISGSNTAQGAIFGVDGVTRSITVTTNAPSAAGSAQSSMNSVSNVVRYIDVYTRMHSVAAATGGPAVPGFPYTVGEEGPELALFGSGGAAWLGSGGQESVMFAQPGVILPADVSARVVTPEPVTLRPTPNLGSPVDEATLRRLAVLVAEETAAKVKEAARPIQVWEAVDPEVTARAVAARLVAR
ncbi:MAG TPA: hypothetical protein VGB14_16290 [Acidimicrobiales bacterium]|jgi:hypothetical protein